MIYTVTFNPSLDYIVSVENFQLGLTNRTSSEMLLPGGQPWDLQPDLPEMRLSDVLRRWV